MEKEKISSSSSPVDKRIHLSSPSPVSEFPCHHSRPRFAILVGSSGFAIPELSLSLPHQTPPPGPRELHIASNGCRQSLGFRRINGDIHGERDKGQDARTDHGSFRSGRRFSTRERRWIRGLMFMQRREAGFMLQPTATQRRSHLPVQGWAIATNGLQPITICHSREKRKKLSHLIFKWQMSILPLPNQWCGFIHCSLTLSSTEVP